MQITPKVYRREHDGDERPVPLHPAWSRLIPQTRTLHADHLSFRLRCYFGTSKTRTATPAGGQCGEADKRERRGAGEIHCQRRLNVDPPFAGGRRSKTDPAGREQGACEGDLPLAVPCSCLAGARPKAATADLGVRRITEA
jgi:hypothetical protein